MEACFYHGFNISKVHLLESMKNSNTVQQIL